MDIRELYRGLESKYGEPAGQWSLWCKRPKGLEEKEAVIIEAILTQRANWKNVIQAAGSLKREGLFSLNKILHCKKEKLEILIKPSGFYRIKADRLKNLADFIVNGCGGVKKAEKIPTPVLKKGLLSLTGVGPETADDILLYAFGRPVFVIDEYTRRLAKKLELTDNFSYRHLQVLFEKGIGEQNYAIYQDFHAFIVIDAQKQ